MLQSINDALKSGKLHDILLRRSELRYLNNIDCDLLEDVIQLLKPFDEATRHLSIHQAPTLHLVLPTKATLLQDTNRNSKRCHPYTPSLRSFLRKTLSGQEYEEVINTLAALTETAGTEERARSLEKKQGPPREAVPSPTEVHDFFSFCVEKQQQEGDSGGISESWGRQFVVEYMSDSKLTGFQSLLNFWHERSDGLVPVARRLLAIPATSTPSERSFSVAGRLIEERRSTLNPENVDELLFLHSNL
ncbi:zinc finger protein 618-like [Nematolebias whitei]|uniref:zinc finger protein 618-like n=1 Tax=Nematolebias whitei TaxID=451745 RepID=UPI00189B73D9|nr:zinc finger protein 618-like [Nematolebias whitei]